MSQPHTAHVHIMGFRETTRTATGIEKKIWFDRREAASAGNWVLPPMDWNSDWKAIANLIGRNLEPGGSIYVYAYSWGCGNGFVKLARALKSWGIRVNVACLCDPVFRSSFLAFDEGFLSLVTGPLRWRSLVNRGPLAPKIKIPDNVDEVRWCRQFQNKPQAHDLVAEDEDLTTIQGPIVVERDHTLMDDSPTFADICRGAQTPWKDPT